MLHQLYNFRKSYRLRLHLLFLFTAAIVAFVRNRLQYGSGFYMWDTLSGLAVSLILHLMAVWFFSAFCAIFIMQYRSYFIEDSKSLDSLNLYEGELHMESTMIYVTMTILFASVIIGILAFFHSTGVRFTDPSFD